MENRKCNILVLELTKIFQKKLEHDQIAILNVQRQLRTLVLKTQSKWFQDNLWIEKPSSIGKMHKELKTPRCRCRWMCQICCVSSCTRSRIGHRHHSCRIVSLHMVRGADASINADTSSNLARFFGFTLEGFSGYNTQNLVTLAK